MEHPQTEKNDNPRPAAIPGPGMTSLPARPSVGNGGATSGYTNEANPLEMPARDSALKGAGATYTEPPAYFNEALEDSERLLKYAAEAGIDIDVDTRDHVLEARAASVVGWSEEVAANLLDALTKLAARLKPVSAASLKAVCENTRPTVHTYWWVAICLAIIIVPFSLASFVSSAISSAMRTDIATANDLAVKLRTQLGPPSADQAGAASIAPKAFPDPDGVIISELQQYSSTIRSIYGRARQLNALVLKVEPDPFETIQKNPAALHDKLQLPSELDNFAIAANDRTKVYQDVRFFAQSLLDDVSFFYGAVSTCLLPVLYALLGTCAYLLRTFEQQMTNRTFMPTIANSARFLIAAIGGAVVGLFNNFTITQGASIPPLAIAFLVGYAVDVFFAFLEGLLQMFTRSGASAAPSSAPGGKA